MEQSFIQFLMERRFIPEGIAGQLRKRRFIREPIGMIAVGHGILDPNAIDKVLDHQRGSDERFGEIAVRLGLLSHEQVAALMKIQDFRLSAEVAEALALSGILPIEDAALHLSSYFTRDRESVACPAVS